MPLAGAENLNELASARSLRNRISDRSVIFAYTFAPTFAGLRSAGLVWATASLAVDVISLVAMRSHTQR